MSYLFIKFVISGFIVVAASEFAKRSPSLGALIASLPLVSILAVVWLWHETANTERVADHLFATFWYVLPSLPMFLAMPALLRQNVPFWIALLFSCALTIALYMLVSWALAKFNIGL